MGLIGQQKSPRDFAAICWLFKGTAICGAENRNPYREKIFRFSLSDTKIAAAIFWEVFSGGCDEYDQRSDSREVGR